MATLFTLLKKQTSGMATVFARVQCSHPKVNVRVSTGIEVDAAKWNLKRDGVAFRNFQSSPEGEKLFNYLGKIEKAINYQLEQGTALTSPDVRKIIEEIVFEEEKRLQEEKMEQERLEMEKANRLTLNQYMDKYVHDSI